MDLFDMAGLERDRTEISRGDVHGQSLTTQRTDDRQKAASVIANNKNLAHCHHENGNLYKNRSFGGSVAVGGAQPYEFWARARSYTNG